MGRWGKSPEAIKIVSKNTRSEQREPNQGQRECNDKPKHTPEPFVLFLFGLVRSWWDVFFVKIRIGVNEGGFLFILWRSFTGLERDVDGDFNFWGMVCHGSVRCVSGGRKEEEKMSTISFYKKLGKILEGGEELF